MNAGIKAEDYLKLVWQIVYKHRSTLKALGIEDDDAFQIGAIGLIKAIKTNDPKHEVPFGAYATTLIKRELYNHFQYLKAKRRNGVVLSLDAPISESGHTYKDLVPDSQDVADIVITKMTTQELTRKLNCLGINNLLQDRLSNIRSTILKLWGIEVL